MTQGNQPFTKPWSFSINAPFQPRSLGGMVNRGCRAARGMRGRTKWAGWRRTARVSALLLVFVALASCSGPSPFATKESKYSRRVVDPGDPVPKGGGSYKVGQPYLLN